jgi:hypothetical protein
MKDDEGATPLHYATLNGHPDGTLFQLASLRTIIAIVYWTSRE